MESVDHAATHDLPLGLESAPARPAADVEFERVYRDYFGFAWSSLRRLGVPQESLEDAVQDLFMVVHRRLGEFEGRSTLRTWLFAIARRVAARHRRSFERRARKVAALAREPRAEDPLDGAVARRQAAEIVHAFLDELDDGKRAVFVLHLFEEMSGPEIAKALDLKLNTVYSRLRLTRERFDALCARLGDEASVLAAEREDAAPPDGAMRRVAAMLPLSLGGGAEVAAATAAGGTIASKIKVFVITLTVGLVGIGVAGTIASDDDVAGSTAPTVLADDEPARAPIGYHAPDRIERVEDPPPEEPVQPAVDPRAPAPVRAGKAPRRASKALPVDRLREEVRFIDGIRSAYHSGDMTGVLRLTRRHAREFPDGALTAEREGFRAMALCKLDDGDAAAVSAAYLGRHGSSALAEHVRVACKARDR